MSTEFLTVHDAKEAGLIPGPWHPYFSEKCVYCGQDMVINFARTVMKCNSTKCYRRVANQADALLKDLGYKGWGPETLTDYCRMTHISSISELIIVYRNKTGKPYTCPSLKSPKKSIPKSPI